MNIQKLALWCALSAAPLLGGTGCASYEPRPLSAREELTKVSKVDLSQLHLRALPGFIDKNTTGFDLSDGFNEAEVVAVALTLDPGLQAKRVQIGEADALLISAGLWPNPEVGVGFRPGLGVSGFEVDGEMFFELLRLHERSARTSIAQAHLDQVKAEIAAEEYEVAGKVRLQWLAVLTAERSVALLQEEIGLRRRALELARHRRDLGEGTALDVALAELELAELGRDAKRTQGELEAAQGELRRQMGLPTGYPLTLSDSGKVLAVTTYGEISDATIQERVLNRRQDIRAKEHAYQAAEEELRLAVLKQYPRLKVGPSYGHDGEGGNFLGVGAALELPLFDRNQGEIAEKRSQRDRVGAEYRALLFERHSQAAAALADMTRAREEIDAQEKEVLPQLAKTQALFEGAFNARELSVAEWLIIQQRALRTRHEYIEALTRYRQAVIRLETAIGQMLVPARAASQPSVQKKEE